MIYLDNSATSFYKPSGVKKILKKSINKLTANAGRSAHKPAQKIAKAVFEAREKVKHFFNAKECEVVFTKNCTEALNLALTSLLQTGDKVITSVYEHNSVLRTLERLKNKGVVVEYIDCDLKDFHKYLQDRIDNKTKLIVCTAISNVVGEISNISEIGAIAKHNGILFLVDGAQGCGHLPLDMQKQNIDLLAFSGHKGLLSITGVGGLVVKKDVKLSALICGGTGTDSNNLSQPNDVPEGVETGTLPTIPILTLSAGIDFLTNNFYEIYKREKELSSYMFERLKELDFVILYSSSCSKNVFAFNVKGKDCSLVANELSEKYNICVRSGLQCAPLIHKKLGTSDSGVVRASLDFNNTKREIDKFVFALKKISKN